MSTELLAEIRLHGGIPRHVAIITDGNGRWGARERGHPREFGHRAGMLIRTPGEYRISNFMLWQRAYTQLHVTPVLWPNFTGHDLSRAIRDDQRRERRFRRVLTG